jgi:TPP-dependent pyruvate/acetoin dehydrogenase alpha subunit
MNKDELIAFEEDIAEEFNAGRIRAPVHLYNGNEDEIIEVFKEIRERDWVLCSWRSHYQCLLKGVPAPEVKQAIMEGQSISLCFPEYRIFSSAIVSGVLPIAVGIGLAIARDGLDENVFCFVGDMTSETGSFEECYKYVRNFDLPVKFVIEDNGRSILTDTKAVWNMSVLTREKEENRHLNYYKYENKWPHAGAGKRVKF